MSHIQAEQFVRLLGQKSARRDFHYDTIKTYHTKRKTSSSAVEAMHYLQRNGDNTDGRSNQQEGNQSAINGGHKGTRGRRRCAATATATITVARTATIANTATNVAVVSRFAGRGRRLASE